MDHINVLMKVVITTFSEFCEYFLGGWNTILKVLVIYHGGC